ncbi:MAG: helix-turn-helix domain-containing protein [Aestuariibacter sp.]
MATEIAPHKSRHHPELAQIQATGDQLQQLLAGLAKTLEQQELDPASYTHHSRIPDVVSRYRREHKMNKGDLALLAGVTPNTLTKLLNNHPNMRVETVLSILESLGLTLYVGPLDG